MGKNASIGKAFFAVLLAFACVWMLTACTPADGEKKDDPAQNTSQDGDKTVDGTYEIIINGQKTTFRIDGDRAMLNGEELSAVLHLETRVSGELSGLWEQTDEEDTIKATFPEALKNTEINAVIRLDKEKSAKLRLITVISRSFSGGGDPTETFAFDETGYLIEEKNYTGDGVCKYRHQYTYEENGNRIEENTYDGNGTLVSRRTCIYDENGNCTEENLYDGDGKLTDRQTSVFNEKGICIARNTLYCGDEIREKQEKYDEQGKLLEETAFDGDGKLLYRYRYNENGEQIPAEINTYYENGKCQEQEKFNEKGIRIEHTVYTDEEKLKEQEKFDEKGCCIEEIRYEEDGKFAFHHTYAYDEIGNLIESNNFDGAGKLEFHYTFAYDEKGNRIEENIFHGDGKTASRYSYVYDENRNLIEEKFYSGEGKLLSRYTYTYDEKGNRVETKHYDGDGNLIG